MCSQEGGLVQITTRNLLSFTRRQYEFQGNISTSLVFESKTSILVTDTVHLINFQIFFEVTLSHTTYTVCSLYLPLCLHDYSYNEKSMI